MITFTRVLVGFRCSFSEIGASAEEQPISTQTIVNAVVQNTADRVSLGAVE